MRVDIICARQGSAFNVGMCTVDFAALEFFERTLPGAELRFWSHFVDPDEAKTQRLGNREIEYRSIWPDPSILNGDVRVYWGDFLHEKSYLDKESHSLAKAVGCTQSEAKDFVDHVMLAKGISKQALQRTLLIGGTLIYQSCSDYARHRDSYTVHLETLLRSVPSLFFRDPFSAARARIIRKGVDPHDCLTVDNSLLLGNENPPVERTDREGCAVFFGRTDPVRRIAYRFGRVPTKLLGRFAFDVCDELDLPATWIPWGYGTSLNDLQRQTAHQFPGLAGWPDRDAGLQSLLDRLAKFKLVITDTYHLAVNAWRLGVPAICLADAVPRVPWLSGSSGMPFRWRDKRQTFYQQYDAQDFYVYLDELRDWRWRRRRIAQLVDLLRDGQAESEVCGLIRAHRDLACKQIETAVRSVSSRVNAPSLGDVRVDPLVPQVTTI